MIRFAKMAANLDGHPKVRRAGRAGREVFLFVLRKNAELDRSGRVPVDRVEPWFLADQLMMSEAEASDGLQRALKAGLLEHVEGHVSIVGWGDEWAKAPLDETERKRRQREREASRPVTAQVTNGHGANVTDRDCPDSHTSDQIRSEEIRSEETRAPEGATRPADAKPKARKCRLPSDWKPNETAIEKARTLGVNVAREAETFRDHHTAKGSTFLDWHAAFRTWLGNAQRFGRSGSYAPKNNPTETALEGLRESEARERNGGSRSLGLFDDLPHPAEAAS